MVDILREDLVALNKAPDVLPGRPSYMTLHRYARKGKLGVKLATVKIAGKRYTSRRLFAEFIERVSAIENGDATPPLAPPADRSPRQRRASSARAAEQLDRLKV